MKFAPALLLLTVAFIMDGADAGLQVVANSANNKRATLGSNVVGGAGIANLLNMPPSRHHHDRRRKLSEDEEGEEEEEEEEEKSSDEEEEKSGDEEESGDDEQEENEMEMAYGAVMAVILSGFGLFKWRRHVKNQQEEEENMTSYHLSQDNNNGEVQIV
jgi:cobalamin biosynthesis protein CobT